MKSKFSPKRAARPRLLSFFPAVVLAAAVLFSGCASVQSISPASLTAPASAVRIGDRVDCTLVGGSHSRFTITDVAPDALIGGSTRIAITDITSLTVTRFDPVKTTEVTILVIAGLGLAAFAVGEAVHHMSIGFPGK